MDEKLKLGSRFDAQTVTKPSVRERLHIPAKYRAEHWRNGELLWAEEVKNVVANDGQDYMLGVGFVSATAITSWFAGLKNAGTASAAQSISGHAAWNEVVAYTGNRKAVTFGAVSGQSIDNSASVAVFSASGTMTAAGAFIVSNATKSGTVGVLYSVADFSTSRSMVNGDVLNLTVTLTAGQEA